MTYQGSKMGNETIYTCENSTVPLPLVKNYHTYVLAWTPFQSTQCLPTGKWEPIAFECKGK